MNVFEMDFNPVTCLCPKLVQVGVKEEVPRVYKISELRDAIELVELVAGDNYQFEFSLCRSLGKQLNLSTFIVHANELLKALHTNEGYAEDDCGYWAEVEADITADELMYARQERLQQRELHNE